MDTKMTGELIAARRKDLGLTQKQLAQQLHVSDRTVSKWERGAGFPDIVLLSPLADTLGISVVSLLQGKIAPEQNVELSLRSAIQHAYRQSKRKFTKNFVTIFASVLLGAFTLWFCWAMLEYNGVFLKDVSMSVPVTQYVDGQVVSESSITIEGKRAKNSFSGVFSTPCIERSSRPGAKALIGWGESVQEYDFIEFYMYGEAKNFGVERRIYISEDMTRMALQLEDGSILATDESLMELIRLDAYYPLDF